MNDDHNPLEEFLGVAAATFIGAYIGNKLDHTRFGRWFNTSPTMNAVFVALRLVATAIIIGLVLLFLFFLLPQF